MNEKELEDYQWSDQIHFPPNLDRTSLESLSFIKRKENVILTEAQGTGNYRKFLVMERNKCICPVLIEIYVYFFS